jgi:glyoxylate reductase
MPRRLEVSPMTRPALYVSRLLPEPVMAAVRQRFRLTSEPTVSPPTRPGLLKGLEEAEAAICTLTEQIDEDALRRAPRLRVIANCAVGFNNIAVEAARARGIVVTNTPDVLTEATADLTWALILAASRRIVEGDALVRSGQWDGWAPTQLLGAEVSGRTLGVVGLGRIGTAVARRAAGFRMAVCYCREGTATRSDRDPHWERLELDELLARADFISLHVPLTPKTRHLIGETQLRRMRPSGFLINTSRGPVVDEAALVRALQEGWLAGAGLDVYEQEPAIHPGLRALSQVVLLPHLGSATRDTRVNMGMRCVENIVAVLEGRPAPNPVV